MAQGFYREPRGASRLDSFFPNWEVIIDTDCLDIASENDCVLGQLFGSFTEGRKKLGLSREEAVQEGFFAPTHAWLCAISERLPRCA